MQSSSILRWLQNDYRTKVSQLHFTHILREIFSTFSARQNALVTDKRMYISNYLHADPCEQQWMPLRPLHLPTFRQNYRFWFLKFQPKWSSAESWIAAARYARNSGHKLPRRPLCLAWAKSGERRAGSQFWNSHFDLSEKNEQTPKTRRNRRRQPDQNNRHMKQQFLARGPAAAATRYLPLKIIPFSPSLSPPPALSVIAPC